MRGRADIESAALVALAGLLLALAWGCARETHAETIERVRVTGALGNPVTGGPAALPVDLRLDREVYTDSTSTSGPDAQAVGLAVQTVAGAVAQGAGGGVPWGQIAGYALPAVLGALGVGGGAAALQQRRRRKAAERRGGYDPDHRDLPLAPGGRKL